MKRRQGASWTRRLLKKDRRREERVGSFPRDGCECRIDLAAGAGVEDLDFQPHSAGSLLPPLSP